MKKPNILARIFNWNAIYAKIREELLEELKNNNQNDSLQNNSLIEKLEKMYQENLIGKDKENDYLKEKIFKKQEEINNIKTKISEKDGQIKQLNENLKNQERDNQNLTIEKQTLDSKLKISQDDLIILKEREQQTLKEIQETTNKVFNTFHRNIAKRGKINELSLEVIFENSGWPIEETWTKNLKVGNKIVEFAVKTLDHREKIKWIPIDSKVIGVEVQSEDEVEINKELKASIEKQAKEITKYIGKSNTANFAIMVLSSDDLFMKLFNSDFKNLYDEIFQKYKVFIHSPSTFLQSVSSLRHLLSMSERIKDTEEIFKNFDSMFKNIESFNKRLGDVHKNFNLAYESYLPKINDNFNKTKKLIENKQDFIESKTK